MSGFTVRASTGRVAAPRPVAPPALHRGPASPRAITVATSTLEPGTLTPAQAVVAEEELRGLASLLSSPEGHSVVLSGPPGCGKETLVRRVLALASVPRPALFAVGSGALRETRLGLLEPWLGGRRSEGIGLRDALAAVRTALGPREGHAPLMLVEEGQHVDTASAQVLTMLVASGEARLLFVTCQSSFGPGVLGGLLEDPRVRRISVAPLDDTRARTLLEETLRGRLTDAAAARLVRWGGGTPQLLRAVLEQCIDDGTLLRGGHRWVLEALEVPHGAGLARAVDDLLDRLDPAVVEAIARVASAPGTSSSGLAAVQRETGGETGIAELLGTGLVSLREGGLHVRSLPLAVRAAARVGYSAPPEAAASGSSERSGATGDDASLEAVMARAWDTAEASGPAAALAGLAGEIAARPEWAEAQHGPVSLSWALLRAMQGRHAEAVNAARDAAAELWLRDRYGLAPAATAIQLLGHAAAQASAPQPVGPPAVLLAGALALCEVEPLGGPAAMRWAMAAQEAPAAVARMVLLCARNSTVQATAVTRIQALADAVPGGWPDGVMRELLGLGQGMPERGGAARVLEGAHAKGHVVLAIATLSWLLRARGEQMETAEVLALRRLLGRWIQDARSHSGPEAFARVGATIVLTEREREITVRTQAGMSNRQIAKELFLSQRTVEGHLYRAFQKLGIGQRSELQGIEL